MMNVDNTELDDSEYETEEETLVYLPLESFEDLNVFAEKQSTFEFRQLNQLASPDADQEKLSMRMKERMHLSGELKNNCGTLLFFQDQAAADSLAGLGKEEVNFIGSSINICPLKIDKIIETSDQAPTSEPNIDSSIMSVASFAASAAMSASSTQVPTTQTS